MKLIKKNFRPIVFIVISTSISLFTLNSCKKLTDVDPPATSLTQGNVYTTDATSIAVLTGLYQNMATGLFVTGNGSISYRAGLSSDELSMWSGATFNPSLQNYYKNSLFLNGNTYYGSEPWGPLYSSIFTSNSAIEGIEASQSLTPAVKQQLLGEAHFIRALCYFYVVNLYGDAPLAITTSYKINNLLSRSPVAKVWELIINDLKLARDLLSPNYLNGSLSLTGSPERVRPTKWAATALLARSFLYTNQYDSSESCATAVINSGLYSLPTLNNAFLKSSSEAIWQLQALASQIINTWDAYYFIIPSTGLNQEQCFYMNSSLVNSFEVGDNRKTSWMNTYTSTTPPITTIYYPYKYKLNNTGTGTPNEYLMVLRLGEQYLIRAEARARQNNLSGAAADLNVLRARAGTTLPAIVPGTQAAMLAVVAHERQVELFSEWGHRWLDLKRTGTVDAVMTVQTPLKGGTWNTIQQLYPLPYNDLLADPNLTQNPGY